jgi:alpha-tubulin suppressor-like RCC1 family protein
MHSISLAGLSAAGALLLTAFVSACGDDDRSPAGPDTAPPALAAAAATALVFRQVTAGAAHSCGVTEAGKAYCWGANYGALGTGQAVGPEYCLDDVSCSRTPRAVAGGLTFRSVTAGNYFTCGVTTLDKAYCWGLNGNGQLGDGSTTVRAAPVAVAGGISFRALDAGDESTCGVSPEGKAYCWGFNRNGQLGDGTRTDRLRPVPVAGQRVYRSVSVGGEHACAVAAANAAFCWGSNDGGQLGDSTTAGQRLRPVRVAGARQWRQVAAGTFHTCGVTLDDHVLCWGSAAQGQLGDGGTTSRSWPRAVAGTLAFERVTSGRFHSCAESTGNRAYCWGANFAGQLGLGTDVGPQTCENGWVCSTRPRAVHGGLFFAQVGSGSGNHVCARTSTGAAYCWGADATGQLGVGTDVYDIPAPVAVLGPS